MTLPSPKTSAAVMAAFDALPEPLRRVVAVADIAYDPDVLAIRLKRDRHKTRLVEEIRARNQRKGVRG
jgi:hypothetical protein